MTDEEKKTVAGEAPLEEAQARDRGEGAKSPDKAAHSGGRCAGKKVLPEVQAVGA